MFAKDCQTSDIVFVQIHVGSTNSMRLHGIVCIVFAQCVEHISRYGCCINVNFEIHMLDRRVWKSQILCLFRLLQTSIFESVHSRTLRILFSYFLHAQLFWLDIACGMLVMALTPFLQIIFIKLVSGVEFATACCNLIYSNVL